MRHFGDHRVSAGCQQAMRENQSIVSGLRALMPSNLKITIGL
jgi:hypothetical protein